METLNKLLTNAKTTEVDAVSSRIVTESKKSDWSADAYLTGIFGLLEPASKKLNIAVNRIKAESDLEEKDEQRDNKVRAVYYLVLGFMHHPDTVIMTAAQKVDAVFEHYGLGITNQSFATESSLIESLLKDFTQAELQAAIAALPGLSQIVNELRTAQTSFEEALLLFEKEKAKEGNEETASVIKKEVLSIINDKLIVYLQAMVQVNQQKYGEFGGTVAQVINDINVQIKKRRKNAEASSESSSSATASTGEKKE
jgi:hypothetical protein